MDSTNSPRLAMTRVRFCWAATVPELDSSVNAVLADLEDAGYGIKGVTYCSGLTVMITYGHGAITTTRWAGRHE